jgi:hypothetical protein
MRKDEEKEPPTLREVIEGSTVVGLREETDKAGEEWAVLTLENGIEIHFRAGAVIVYPDSC